MNYFYVYCYVNPTKPGRFTFHNVNLSFLYEPFYIGKGNLTRINSHVNESIKKKHKTWKNKTILNLLSLGHNPKDYAFKLAEQLTDEEAYSMEKTLITNIGRLSIRKGPLLNIHPGGRGSNSKAHWKTTTKLTPDQETECANLYLKGETVVNLMSMFGVSKTTMHHILLRHNVQLLRRPTEKRSKTLSLIPNILEDYENGMSSIKIGQKYCISKRTVLSELRKAGVTMKEPAFYKTIKDEDVPNIRAAFLRGERVEALAKKYKVSTNTINRAIRYNEVVTATGKLKIKTNITRHNLLKKLTEDQEYQLGQDYIAGMSSSELAAKYNVFYTTALAILKRLNIQTRPSSTPDKTTIDLTPEVIEMYQSGLSSLDIFRKLPVSRNTILRILHRNNVPLRQSGKQPTKVIGSSDAEELDAMMQ